jgi:hypothetical protein
LLGAILIRDLDPDLCPIGQITYLARKSPEGCENLNCGDGSIGPFRFTGVNKERRVHRQELAGCQLTALGLKGEKGLKTQIVYGIGRATLQKGDEVDLKRLEVTGLSVKAIYQSVSEDELITQGILSEWNVGRSESVKQHVRCAWALECGTNGVPLWVKNGSTDMESAAERYETVPRGEESHIGRG